jgi:hypothetical protein
MKQTILKFALIFILCLMPALQTQAAWQGYAWIVIKELAIDTAIDTVQDLFKESVKPEEVAKLRQRIIDVEAKLVASEKQGDYPSIEELNTVKQLVANLKNMVHTMGQRLDSVETRLAKVEKDIVSLRQALLTLPDKGVRSIKNEPLDFKINTVYRTGGKGNVKQLTNGGVLHSGDYYKIIFTPTEDCYVYIFQLDSANKLFRLFPMSSFGGVTVNNFNPIKGGKTYHIPAQDKSFELDEQKGTETIYFIATRQNDVVLESQYQALQEAQQNPNRLQLIQHQTTQTMYAKKGLSAIKSDPAGSTTTWQEDGQQFSVLQRSLQDMCNGCVNILTFQHR